MPKLSIVKVRCERDVNSYVLTCAETSEAVVIDPGEPADKIAGQLEGAVLKWVLVTHGHPGHVAGKDAVRDSRDGALTAMHFADAKQFLRSADQYLVDGDTVAFGRFTVRAIHTPGHTPGSLCFLVANHLFTGDTLVAGGLGKQMPETDLRQQLLSIGTQFATLPLSTALYPGHGPVTSLENEVRTNPYLRGPG
jgi:glyoxylase-like metal-dependent hydrolase (beta-lactamase superfamily II)